MIVSFVFICPIAIAYSMGHIIKSFCVRPCVCVCVSVCGHSRSHFFIDSHQIGHRRVNPQRVRWGSISPHPLLYFPPKNSQFWGVNRRFLAKLAKSKNVHIIKTTASIPTKFCTMIKTTKCSLWVVPTHALQIQDGGRPPSWKNRKIVISQPRFERFRRNLAWWCSLTLSTVPTVKIWNFKNPRWRRPPSWKIEKSPYLGHSFSDLNEIWHGDAVRPSWLARYRDLKKSNMPAAGILTI